MKNNPIIQPMVSEKSYNLANSLNKYTFLVDKAATKTEIAKEIAKKYKVKVLSVNCVTDPGKLGMNWKIRVKTRKQDKKKALVTLKKGDKIENFFNV